MSDPSPKIIFERAISYLKSGAGEEAEALCREVLERDPGDINFVCLLGSILGRRGALNEALELLQRRTRNQ